MRNEKHKTEKTQKARKRGIDYTAVQDAAYGIAEWLVEVAGEDIKGWREGQARLAEVREYLFAKIGGDEAAAPSDDVLVFAVTQLVRAFASDPRTAAGLGLIGRVVEPLMPMVLAGLARATGVDAGFPPTPPAAPACMVATPLGAIRPPGVPISVPMPVAPLARGYVQIRRA